MSTYDKVGFDDRKSVLKLTLSVYDPGDSLMAYAKLHARTLRSDRNGTGYSFLNLGSNKIFRRNMQERENCFISCHYSPGDLWFEPKQIATQMILVAKQFL